MWSKPYFALTSEGRRDSLSPLDVKHVFEHCKHIVRFSLNISYRSNDWWADLASRMTHFQELRLRVGVPAHNSSMERSTSTFRLANLPNLTTLHLCGREENWMPSITLELPTLKILEIERDEYVTTDGQPCVLNIKCPKLNRLTTVVCKKMVLPPNLFTHLPHLDLKIRGVSLGGCIDHGGWISHSIPIETNCIRPVFLIACFKIYKETICLFSSYYNCNQGE